MKEFLEITFIAELVVIGFFILRFVLEVFVRPPATKTARLPYVD